MEFLALPERAFSWHLKWKKGKALVMIGEGGSGLVATLESFAKAFIVGAVLWWIFLLVAWPFINVSRLICYILTFGRVAPTYRQSLEHNGIIMVAFLIFLPVFFYIHIVYGAKLYGNQSN